MTLRSALYNGSVMHRRIRPRRHFLRYRVFWILFDLDEIDRMPRVLRLFSRNRFNAFSLYDSDHGDGSATALRPQIEAELAQAGIAIDGGRIALFSMPRFFGYGFNPLSIYFCHRCNGSLAAIRYEVHNTFGERHSYLIPVNGGSMGGAIEQRCRKAFYVSPFMDMDLNYRFRVIVPGDHVAASICVSDSAGKILVAALAGERQVLSDTALLRALLAYPLLTLKVTAAIHWHALRLWLKGLRLRPRPAPPALPVTVVAAEGSKP
jgi:DUF1365 family protein